MVWHNEMPWHELNVEDELTLRTSSPFTQRIEEELRRRIYLWKHMPGDMVLEPVFYSPMIIENSGIGLNISEETAVHTLWGTNLFLSLPVRKTWNRL